MSELKMFRTNFHIFELLYANLDSDFSSSKNDIVNAAIFLFLKQPDFTKFRKKHSGNTIQLTARIPLDLKKRMDEYITDYSALVNKALEMYYYSEDYPEFDIDKNDIEYFNKNVKTSAK